MSLLITNARIVNEGSITEGDILVSGGRIERVGGQITAGADKVIDAAGKVVLPGMIDDQVHFREPGLTHKADIATESRAAVAGGVTSYMEMPNTIPQTITVERVREKLAIAAQTSCANYAFYLGASNDNLEDVKAAPPDLIAGVKVFLGSSTGNMLVDDPTVLERVFAAAPTLVATHCEHDPTIRRNEEDFRRRFGEDVPIAYHPKIRSAEACYKSTATAIELAERTGARLHVLHISTARELSLFSNRPLAEKKITAEACVHHLFFDEESYHDLGTLIKCNPAIKHPLDRGALIQAVLDGYIDVIATDHAPHTAAEKANTYFQAPSGLPLVQHALLSLLEQTHYGKFKLEMIAEKASHAVADLFQVVDRGYIREGYWADLVIVDLNRPYTVEKENIAYKCGWSPFEGHTFKSTIDTTIVSGQIAYHDGWFDARVRGGALEFGRG